MKPELESASREIQRADPGARTTALWIMGAVIALGVLAFAATMNFEQKIADWARSAAAGMDSPIQFLVVALFVVMLPMVGISIWVFREGSKMVRTQRIPYPGQKVIKDTPVIEGPEAVKRGRAIQFIAVAMGTISLAIPFVPPLIVMFMNQGT